jgi:adenosylcobinamide-phosphate guanylyltransferase
MCGGRGSRLDLAGEKPLVTVGGRPMVERVCDALAASRAGDVYAVTSPATPRTAATVDCPCIEAPGKGYVADLEYALADRRLAEPVLTVAADLPALDGPAVDAVLAAADGGLTAAVPAGRKRALGVSVGTAFRHRGLLLAPAGINVVGDGESVWLTRNPRFAINVNRREDYRRAKWLLTGSNR